MRVQITFARACLAALAVPWRSTCKIPELWAAKPRARPLSLPQKTCLATLKRPVHTPAARRYKREFLIRIMPNAKRAAAHPYQFARGLAGGVSEKSNPYFDRIPLPFALFTNARKSRAAALFLAPASTIAACRMGGCISAGISQRLPFFMAGESARDSAKIPACALPDS